MELNRGHFRAIIFYNFRRGLTQQQCDEAPSMTSVYRWYGEFNLGRSSLQNEFREGRSKSEWQKCFDNWFKRMQKCIDLTGEYFEKQ